MKAKYETKVDSSGFLVDSEHEIEVVCAHCGYDLDEDELAADTCSNCEQTINLRQNVEIAVTTLPVVHIDVDSK